MPYGPPPQGPPQGASGQRDRIAQTLMNISQPPPQIDGSRRSRRCRCRRCRRPARRHRVRRRRSSRAGSDAAVAGRAADAAAAGDAVAGVSWRDAARHAGRRAGHGEQPQHAASMPPQGMPPQGM